MIFCKKYWETAENKNKTYIIPSSGYKNMISKILELLCKFKKSGIDLESQDHFLQNIAEYLGFSRTTKGQPHKTIQKHGSA